MSSFSILCSEDNLLLAWNRINTATNHQVKRYFRHIYASYAIAVEQNVRDLHHRIQHGSYEPQKPVRFFIPKPSGLQRPLTLLGVEDQVVLQAIANVFAAKLIRRRKLVENRFVYSNILSQEKKDIFFLRDWKGSYESFGRKLNYLYKSGYCWLGIFDLAAFYETIDHGLLLKTAFPKGGLGEYHERIMNWFGIWSAEHSSLNHSHGIPQGPIASDYLADCFLLPVDEAMGKRFQYLRYVDDIRIMGRSEQEVRRAAVELEVLCRNRGLIPQAKKYEIRKISSVAEIGTFKPSLIFGEDYVPNKKTQLGGNEALSQFRKCLGGHPLRITDKTKARYVLYRAADNARLSRYVIALLPHHPEHIDIFLAYLKRSTPNKKITNALTRLIYESPYQYVRGEAWQLLALLMDRKGMTPLINLAMVTAKNGRSYFSERWGACSFLCFAERRKLGNYSRWAAFMPSLIQALVTPIIPSERFRKGDIIERFLNRTDIEPGLSLTSNLVQKGLKLRELGIRANNLPGPVRNVYRSVGLIPGLYDKAEPISELLSRSLSAVPWKGWRKLLGHDYAHACSILSQAVPIMKSARSLWLIHQNSFNNLVFVAFQKALMKLNKKGAMALFNKKGEMFSFGTMLQSGNSFSKCYPSIANIMRIMNARRNSVPSAHPYNRSGKITRPLLPSEQHVYVEKLAAALNEIAAIIGSQ